MLKILSRIAVRNVRRNLRRSLITAFGIAIGVFVIVFGRGVVNGLGHFIVHGITETRLGDVQLHHRDYLESSEALTLDKSFAMDERFRSLIASDPRITDAAGRIHFSGLVNQGETNALFFGLAIDPVGEYVICRYQRENILEGEPLRAELPTHVVVGKPLADSMGLKPGSEITVMAHTKLGSLNAMDLTVAGIIEYKMPGPWSRVIQMPLATAQKLLYMDGQVTEVIMNVADLRDVQPVNDHLKRQLEGSFRDLALEPNTWMDVGQQALHMMEEQEIVLRYIILVMYVMMVSGIANTMLMNVFERTREIGTMMAIGVRRRKILSMIMLEACVLGLMGAAWGIACGAGVVGYLEANGLPVFPIGQATQWYRIYPYIRPGYLLWVSCVAMGVGAVSALYPAWRAAKMRPSEALSDH